MCTVFYVCVWVVMINKRRECGDQESRIKMNNEWKNNDYVGTLSIIAFFVLKSLKPAKAHPTKLKNRRRYVMGSCCCVARRRRWVVAVAALLSPLYKYTSNCTVRLLG